METRARYILLGAFVLAVLVAGFGFVYWLNTTGGLGRRDVYRIRFDGPVSGLLKGSAVHFNGIRVGEVTDLSLDANHPSDVITEIAIEARAPVRADTKIGIEFQGLAGAPVVALAGGSATLPLLASAGGKPPMLTAERNAGQGMTEAAREALKNINTLVTENAERFGNTIASLDKFSGALARNSDRVDALFAGLERLTGGGAKVKSRLYDLTAVRVFPGLQKRFDGQLAVPIPTGLSLFDSDRLLVRGSPDGELSLDNAQWPDQIPNLMQARIVQSFENAQYAKVIGQSPDEAGADMRLLIDIRSFNIVTEPKLTAEIDFAARLVAVDGRIVASRIFNDTEPVDALDGPSAAKALNSAFVKVATDLVLWTGTAIP